MTVQPIVRAAKEDVTEFARDAGVALGGVATTLAVVFANQWAAQRFDFDLLSLSAYFVLPFGAILGGLAAAIGYFVAARATHAMPSRRLAWEMMAIGVSAWALHHWLAYNAYAFDDGTRARDVVDFWTFLQASIVHQSLVVEGAGASGFHTGELGAWGYLREILQLLGFVLGGWAAFGMLRNSEACAPCRRYAKTTRVMREVTPQQFALGLASAGLDAVEVAPDPNATLKGRRLTGMDLLLARCPRCAGAWLRPGVRVPSGRTTASMPLARVPVSGEQADAVLAMAPTFRKRDKAA